MMVTAGGCGGCGAGMGEGAWDDPSAWAMGPSWTPPVSGGTDWASVLAPVVPGTMNLLTAMYTPPAYQTQTGPGGSQTTMRYPNVPSTIPGYSSAPVVPGTGITNTTIMIIAAAAVALLVMNRR